MLNKILDFLYPPKCAFCHDILTERVPVCKECLETLPYTQEQCCHICGRPLDEFSHEICNDCRSEKRYFKHSFVPLVYEGAAKESILALKASHPYYAKAFAFLIADRILSSPHFEEFDAITFVPQSRRKERERGYNVTELIAKELSLLLKIPSIPTLYRSDDGLPQHTLTREERRKNVKKCYFPTDVKGSGKVLLVDDIYTTGSTANYCSKLLLQMGFEEVYLAIGLIRTDGGDI